jgi:hypothetical protein
VITLNNQQLLTIAGGNADLTFTQVISLEGISTRCANTMYYVTQYELANPRISDAQFDILEKQVDAACTRCELDTLENRIDNTKIKNVTLI